MKLLTKLVLTGSAIAAAGVLGFLLTRDRRECHQPQRAIAGADPEPAARPYDPGDDLVEEAILIATSSGIANVDPGPLAQTAGEGIALEPVTAAHTELEDLRERLPRPGKTT